MHSPVIPMAAEEMVYKKDQFPRSEVARGKERSFVIRNGIVAICPFLSFPSYGTTPTPPQMVLFAESARAETFRAINFGWQDAVISEKSKGKFIVPIKSGDRFEII